MYLKAIQTQGFKSFADKIDIDLDGKITGIVGPNGSGKSNVVDAIRWVLGEQRVKALRGEGNMTDVIFSGSKTRNASNIATVTLVFDNKDKYLNIELDEIAIKRRLYKDGTNEYYLNNELVRLKDITNLLLDSGMAKESFNIISQGKIEEILSNKPEDRRVVFEEAAGVLKYKKRKEESLRKLDKTHQNMNRVNDIIGELEVQLTPLKEQSEQAIKYSELKNQLENIEISLIASDITNLNFEYQKNKQLIDNLQKELEKISTSNRVGEANIEKFKKDIEQLDVEIRNKQNLFIEYTTKLEQLNSRKTIIAERIKYQQNDTVQASILNLKENNLHLKSEIEQLKLKLEQLKNTIININNELNNSKINDIKKQKEKLNNDLSILIKHQNHLNIKIDTIKHNIETNSALPVAVKRILENPKLRGIHNIVGNLFDVEEKYSKAISVALGASTTNIVVDDEQCAKEAITYLKTNHLGRTTFLPLNIIKPRYIDIKGEFKLASDLIKYDSKYISILLNLLGNVLIVNNIDEANRLAKQLNYKYRIVTLDGEIINIGGSLTGGKLTSTNIILEKYNLEHALNELKNVQSNIGLLEEKGNEIDNLLKSNEDKYYLINKEKIEQEIIYNNLKKELIEYEEKYKINELDLTSNANVLENKINKEQEEILNEYYQTLEVKNKLNIELENLNKEKNYLKEQLSNYEFSLKRENSLFNEKNETLKQCEIMVNRLDVKLDNLLNTLSDVYSITYEEATTKYILDISVSSARNIVSNLKRQLNDMGIVNIAAIEEYEKVSTRLTFLIEQKEDLLSAEDVLLNIIEQMDKIMKKEFVETFEIIKENFKATFKDLFKGGSADLVLTDKENILETGIDIIASPPGKSLKTISLLSGGEKTFTAISLLFAILKSKPVPFCIFDEVEAALDDVNVDSFGKYVQGLKAKTQFILITHKKKTMEYVDTLYGITMQESGVSKLVSVKLEDVKI